MKKSLLLLAVALVVNFASQSQNNIEGDLTKVNATELAESLLPLMHHLEMQTQPHFEGKLKVMSVPGNWVIAGFDEDKDGVYDRFFYAQTNEDYAINLEMENGQLLYGKSCFIVTDIKGSRINFYSINPSDDQVTAVWSNLPKHLKDISKGQFGTHKDLGFNSYTQTIIAKL